MRPKNYIIPIFVPHLGCPNDCVFCNQRRISGQVEPATARSVKAEIESALDKIQPYAKVQLAFYGGSFTAIEPSYQLSLLEAAAPYIKEGKIDSIRLSTRPDCIDSETVERLLPYKVDTIELGVQSMCDDVLDLSGRGHSACDAEKASEVIKSYGINLILQMMTGLPGDTKEKSVYTARKLASLKPQGVRVYPTVIIKDTRLYDMWVQGKYREHTVADAVDVCSEILPIFEDAGIQVIRLGLNPTDELSGGSAVAGAYHPALGQLVHSRIYLKRAEEMLIGSFGRKAPPKVEFTVSKGNVSTFIGQKRCNIVRLKDEFGIEEIKVSETDKKVDKQWFLELKNDIA